MNLAIDPIITAWREGGVLLVAFLFFWFRGHVFTKEIASVYTIRMQNQHALAAGNQATVERLLDQIDYGRVTDLTIIQTLEEIRTEIKAQYNAVNLKLDQIIANMTKDRSA